jgi:hypothetical protein
MWAKAGSEIRAGDRRRVAERDADPDSAWASSLYPSSIDAAGNKGDHLGGRREMEISLEWAISAPFQGRKDVEGFDAERSS